MRIRRRPPGQPLAYLLPIDPPAAPQSPQRASVDRTPVPGGKQGDDGELHLHPASATNDSAADLGDARCSSSPLRRPALPPQDGAVEEGLVRLLGAQQSQQQGPADGRSISLENGHQRYRHMPEPGTNTNQPGGDLLSNNVNGVGAAVAVTTAATAGAEATEQQQQEETTQDTSGSGSGGGTRRAPRGPGTLMEGSRCSRKNGRGWRCYQQTLVGYALCQYHLGKGRVKSGSVATAGRGRGRGRGAGQLGRTEHANKTFDAAVDTATAAAAPMTDVPPPPPSVQHW